MEQCELTRRQAELIERGMAIACDVLHEAGDMAGALIVITELNRRRNERWNKKNTPTGCLTFKGARA